MLWPRQFVRVRSSGSESTDAGSTASPIPVVEPYLRVGAGYAWQGDANYTVTTAGVTTQPATTVYGWAIDAALGVDIFLANWFTIGAGIGLDVLNMTRHSGDHLT